MLSVKVFLRHCCQVKRCFSIIRDSGNSRPTLRVPLTLAWKLLSAQKGTGSERREFPLFLAIIHKSLWMKLSRCLVNRRGTRIAGTQEFAGEPGLFSLQLSSLVAGSGGALLATVFRVVFLWKASSFCASSSFRCALDILVFFILKHHIRNRIVQNTIIPLTYSMLSVVMVAPVALFHFLFQATKRDRIHFVSACVFVALSQGVHRTRIVNLNVVHDALGFWSLKLSFECVQFHSTYSLIEVV